MTTVAKDDGCLCSDERNLRVPQQLFEANELLKSINRRLEDCALEWQAEISRQQWKIFNSKVTGATRSAEQSLLARTYFTERELDEAFKHLLSCNKIFSEYLNNFIDLLRGTPDSDTKECNVQNELYGTKEKAKNWQNSDDTRTEETNRFPTTDDRRLNAGGTIRNYLDNLGTVKNSFTDVIKAKLDFDTKFLGFEAVLHKATTTSLESCICRYSSNNTQSTRGRKLRSVTVNQRNRTIARTKRLTRPVKTRLLRKRKREKPTIIIGDSGDQPLVDIGQTMCKV